MLRLPRKSSRRQANQLLDMSHLTWNSSWRHFDKAKADRNAALATQQQPSLCVCVRVTKLSVTACGVCNRIVHDRIVCDRDVRGRRQAAIALGSLLTCFQLCHNCSSLVRFRLSEEIVDLEKYMKNGLARALDPASSRFYNKEKMSRRNPISPRLSEMVIRSGNTILSSSAASPSYSHQQETKGAEASNRKRRDRISLAFQNT